MSRDATATTSRRHRTVLLKSLVLATLLIFHGGSAVHGSEPQVVALDDFVDIEPLRPMTILIDPLANDYHLDGDALFVQSTTQPQIGTVTPHVDGSLTLEITAAELLSSGGRTRIEFAYTVRSSNDETPVTAEVCVGRCLQVPELVVCHLDPVEATVHQPEQVFPLANDEPSAEALQLVNWTQGSLGTVVPGEGDSLIYTGHSVGQETLSYWAQLLVGGPTVQGTIRVVVDEEAQGPSAEATFDYNCNHLTCSFNASDSMPEPSQVQSYEWDFGDGLSTIGGYFLEHTYEQPDFYDVTLTVTPVNGSPDTLTQQLEVIAETPNFNFNYNCYDRFNGPHPESPLECDLCDYWESEPCICDLRCKFRRTDNNPQPDWEYRWDYGDGTVTGWLLWSNRNREVHRFDDGPQVYTVTLEVRSTHSPNQTRTREVLPRVAQPLVAFESTCEEGACSFVATGSELDLAVPLAWDFGDGTEGPGAFEVTHAYGDLFPHLVTFRYGDDYGQTFEATDWASGNDELPIEVGVASLELGSTRRVLFSRWADEPVVLAKSLTQRGTSEAASVRVWGIDHLGFNLTVQAPGAQTLPPELDGEEEVGYLVVDSGDYLLPDGTLLEAHVVNGFIVRCPTIHRTGLKQWSRINFDIEFSDPPVVLAQTQESVDPSYVTVRLRDVSERWFDCAVEQEEAAEPWPGHYAEVGWVAISPPVDPLAAQRWKGTQERWHRVAWGKSEPHVTDRWSIIDFARAFDLPPTVVMGLSTYRDPDHAHLRQKPATVTGTPVRVEEDTTLDPETLHDAESVSWLAAEAVDRYYGLEMTEVELDLPSVRSRDDYTVVSQGQYVEILVLENDPDRQGGDQVLVNDARLGEIAGSSVYMKGLPASALGFDNLFNYSVMVGYSAPESYLGVDRITYRVRGRGGQQYPGSQAVSDAATVTIDIVDRPPDILLQDTFDSTTLDGWVVKRQSGVGTAAWQADPAKGLLQTGDTRPPSGSPDVDRPGTYLVWQGGGGWIDYEMSFLLGTTEAEGDVGLMFRYIDRFNFYRVSWDVAAGTVRLVRRQRGEYTLLGEAPSPLIPGESPVRFGVRVEGDRITVGRLPGPWAPPPVLMVDDPGGPEQGSVAFYASGNGGFRADDVLVRTAQP